MGLIVNGTAGVMVATQNFGVLPTKNRQQGTVDGWEKIQGEELTKRFRIKKSACYGCPIGCVRKAKAPKELNRIRRIIQINVDKIFEAWHEHCG